MLSRTFHQLPFVHPSETPAAFTTPSMVRIRMLPIRSWCTSYRPTYNFGCILLPTACYRWAVVDGFPNFCNELLPSASRASHFSRLAIISNPEETHRICCHRRNPLQERMGFNDLSHIRFKSKFLGFASVGSPHAWQIQQHRS